MRRRPLGANGIVKGAEPIKLERDGAPAALLLHGGGDTPQVMADLAAHLHANGFAVSVPLLSNHGRALSALTSAAAAAWHQDTEREYEILRARHEWTAVVGLSMGGALAIKLAAERSDIPALVLLAPYVAMPARIRRIASLSGYWGWAVPYFSSLGARSIHDAEAAARGRGHGVLTPATLRALSDVVDAAFAAIERVSAPTLVIQSREDNRISVADAEAAFAKLGSAEKRLEWIDGAGHVITVDYGRDRVFEMTRAWLAHHLESRERLPR